ncbi:TolC family protein [Terrimonas pollutisoli]|uniref:TolC family protein n=1 Tax=Terrimonas pollutisoli TaxID=3034147 RepID=UPI0023ED2C52|nr:TolC family protein [Terrimonas sp. H1YJ31]
MVNLKKGLIILVFLPSVLWAQVNKLTLEDAYREAQANYPVIKQKDLVRQTAELNISNLSKGNLPQLSFNGQASYQSDVTNVNVPLPGVKIPTPQKDQYKITADISQVLFDGGVIKEQKVVQQLNAGVEEQKVEVELYKLKERINQIYLGILYLDEQLKQLDLVKQDIQIGIKRVEAQVNNGVAFKSNLNVLKAELLKTNQRVIEIKASRKGYVETLGLFLNQALDENIVLEKPAEQKFSALNNTIQRPELELYNNEIKLYEQQNRVIQSKNLPKASLFFQGGYGRPGLNMLDNQFDLFYIGGVKLNWPVSNLYTKKKEKQLVKVNQQIVDTKKETFLLNTNTQLKQQQSEIEKLEQLITTDKEIIDIRASVKDATRAQLENGVTTANDYLREINAEDQARQALITHELQLLQATINYKTISGNQ